MKVPVLATVLSELEHSNEILGPQGRVEATRALEASDNAAAEALFSHLEQTDGGLPGASQAVQATLQAAGDDTTTVNTAPNSSGFTTWGQSEWPASGEVSFYRSLARGCLLNSDDTSYVLGLMRNVESAQRWGAGSPGSRRASRWHSRAAGGRKTAAATWCARPRLSAPTTRDTCSACSPGRPTARSRPGHSSSRKSALGSPERARRQDDTRVRRAASACRRARRQPLGHTQRQDCW